MSRIIRVLHLAFHKHGVISVAALMLPVGCAMLAATGKESRVGTVEASSEVEVKTKVHTAVQAAMVQLQTSIETRIESRIGELRTEIDATFGGKHAGRDLIDNGRGTRTALLMMGLLTAISMLMVPFYVVMQRFNWGRRLVDRAKGKRAPRVGRV